MKVHHFVIHHIQKVQFKDPILQLKDAEPARPKSGGKKKVQKPDLINNFVSSASTMFDRQKSGRVYADIGKDGNTFAEILNSYLEERIAFIDFSKRLAQELAKTMKGTTLATGGYMAVAEYTASPRQLLVIMIKQEIGYAVDPDTLELRESIHLDLGTINVGARINLEAYQKGEEHHLSLVRGLKDLAKYFRTFLGVVNFKSAKDETLDLMNVMEGYFTKNPSEYDSVKIGDVRRQVANLIRDNKGGQTPLITIAAIICPSDPDDFHDYANNLGVSTEVSGDLEVMKSWLRVSYKGAKMHLDFDKSLLHESIDWDEQGDALTITVSAFPKLADKLKDADK